MDDCTQHIFQRARQECDVQWQTKSGSICGLKLLALKKILLLETASNNGHHHGAVFPWVLPV